MLKIYNINEINIFKMGKYISFGKYNNLYKYIWIYIIIRLFNDYLFTAIFPDQIRPNIFSTSNYPPDIFVQGLFNYLGVLIFSIFLFLYEKKQIKDKGNNVGKKDTTNLMHKYSLIYFNDDQTLNFKLKSNIFVSLLSIFSIQLIKIMTIIGLDGLLYWVFDLFFVANINLILFGIPIYLHKKLSISFILIFATLFKMLSSFEVLFNDKYNLIYKNHIILIPIFGIIYPCLSLTRFYSICKIKWLLDYKYTPLSIFLGMYSFLGILIFLIASLISNNIKCVDKRTLYDIDLICKIKVNNGNITDLYFDNFSNFFGKLWDKHSVGLNILYIFLFIIKILLDILNSFFSALIIKHLNPEFYLCSFELYFFFIRLISLIKQIINKDDINVQLYNIFAEVISLIGITIYLELIEFKFCEINRNLKKNIEKRSYTEYNINKLYSEENEDNEDNESNENNFS